jgi:hypothetical protein
MRVSPIIYYSARLKFDLLNLYWNFFPFHTTIRATLHDSAEMSLFMHQEPQPSRDCVTLKGDKWRPAEESKIIELLGKGLSWREISEELPRKGEDSCSHYYIMLKDSGSNRRADKIMILYDRYDPSHSLLSLHG